MSTKAIAFIGSLLFLSTCGLPALAIDKPERLPLSGKIQWVYDYEQGKRISQETSKPMFVVFRCER